MINLLQHAQDVMAGKTTIDNPRSPRWPAVRDAYLKEHPACAVSGRTEGPSLWHMVEFLGKTRTLDRIGRAQKLLGGLHV